MPDPFALKTFSVANKLQDKDPSVLQFEPYVSGQVQLQATIDGDYASAVHLSRQQIAHLAVHLTLAVGLHPSFELENVTRSDSPAAPGPVLDSRDDLLHAAFDALGPLATYNQQREVAHAIARHLLGPARTQRETP